MRDKRTYTARQLVAAHRAARTWAPDAPFIKIDWCTTMTAREWLAWFRAQLDKRASRGQERTGRKIAWDWQRDCRALARDLAGRIVVRRTHYPTVIRDLRGRVDHRLEEAA